MKLETKFVAIAVLAVVMAIPISNSNQRRSNALVKERRDNGALRIELKTIQQELHEKQVEQDRLRQQNEILEKKLQAKIERDNWLASLTFSVGSAPAWKVRDALAYYMDSGLTKTAAAYLVGNLIAESGLNEAGTGDGGLALGIAQWHPNRRYDMPADYHGQLAFVLVEMRRQTPTAHDIITGSPTADQAAYALKVFEAYGVEGNRFIYAEDILNRI